MEQFVIRLMRALSASKTLVFLLAVRIEEDEDAQGSYCATVKQLGDAVVAVGESPEEASSKLITLFKDMVDHCISEGTLDSFSGMASISREFPLALDDLMRAFEELEPELSPEERPVEPPMVIPYWLHLNRTSQIEHCAACLGIHAER